MFRTIFALFFTLFFLPSQRLPAEAENALYVRLLSFVDGDTYWIQIHGKKEKLRLIGIDTPELDHRKRRWETPPPWREPGEIVLNYVKKHLKKNQSYRLEFDVVRRDDYGRLLGYLYLKDGTLWNEKLLAQGLAALYTFPPNVKYVDRFREAYQEARRNRRGFFACHEIPED